MKKCDLAAIGSGFSGVHEVSVKELQTTLKAHGAFIGV